MSLSGDGAGGLVSALATRDDDAVGVLVWNSSLDQSRIPADPLLSREISTTVSGLEPGRYTLRHWRVDEEHSNVFAAWRDLGGADRDWPEEGEWARLQAADGLAELLPPQALEVAADGTLTVSFALPQPGISYLELRAVG